MNAGNNTPGSLISTRAFNTDGWPGRWGVQNGRTSNIRYYDTPILTGSLVPYLIIVGEGVIGQTSIWLCPQELQLRKGLRVMDSYSVVLTYNQGKREIWRTIGALGHSCRPHPSRGVNS